MRNIFGVLTLVLALASISLFLLSDATGELEYAMSGIMLLLLAIPVMFLALPEQPFPN